MKRVEMFNLDAAAIYLVRARRTERLEQIAKRAADFNLASFVVSEARRDRNRAEDILGSQFHIYRFQMFDIDEHLDAAASAFDNLTAYLTNRARKSAKADNVSDAELLARLLDRSPSSIRST